MSWIHASAVLGFVAGCATATTPGGGNGPQDGSVIIVDAPRPPTQVDAQPAGDAAVALTLSETTDSTLVYGNSIACFQSASGSTGDTIWYRTFQLSDFNVTDSFHVTQVAFSIQESAGTPSVMVKLGSYTGTIGSASVDSTKITPINSATVTIPATTGTTGETVTAPLVADLAAGSKFIVEIVAPDLTGTDNQYIFIGATTAGETHPGYYSSSLCTQTTPETTTAAGGTGQIIINVIGTH